MWVAYSIRFHVFKLSHMTARRRRREVGGRRGYGRWKDADTQKACDHDITWSVKLLLTSSVVMMSTRDGCHTRNFRQHLIRYFLVFGEVDCTVCDVGCCEYMPCVLQAKMLIYERMHTNNVLCFSVEHPTQFTDNNNTPTAHIESYLHCRVSPSPSPLYLECVRD